MFPRLLLILAVVSVPYSNIRAQIGEAPGPGWHYLMATGPDHYGTLRVVNDTLVLTVHRPNDSIPNYHVILYSADHGVTWDSFPPFPQILESAFPSGADGLHPLLWLPGDDDTSGRFAQSFNMGRTWIDPQNGDQIPNELITPGRFLGYVRKLADPNEIWVGSRRTRDYGRTWSNIRLLIPAAYWHGPIIRQFLFDRTDPKTWYESTSDAGVPNSYEFYQTTDDGLTFSRVNHWAQDAGVAYAGEMRSYSSSPKDLYGGRIDTYTGELADTGRDLGFNSYSPFDSITVLPQFINLFGKLLPIDSSLTQFASKPQYLGSPQRYKFAAVQYQAPYESPLAKYRVVIAITSDDARSYRILLDLSNRFVSDAIDPGTGKYYVRIPRDSTVIHTSFPPSDSFDYWYTDNYRDLLTIADPTESNHITQSVTIRPSIVNQRATIAYAVNAVSQSRLSIYDLTGRALYSFPDGTIQSLSGTIEFTVEDLHLIPGFYFLRLSSSETLSLASFIVR